MVPLIGWLHSSVVGLGSPSFECLLKEFKVYLLTVNCFGGDMKIPPAQYSV